jgi:hypothetical protein
MVQQGQQATGLGAPDEAVRCLRLHVHHRVHRSKSDREAIHYRSRILRLALLAPEIVEAILAGQTDHVPVRERLE